MIKTPHDLCTGCGACKSICPVNAIEMKQDKDGFLYPDIHSIHSKCISCRKCEKVCPVQAPIRAALPLKAYGLKCKDLSLRQRSASGGAFGVLVQTLFSEGDQAEVFGAKFDDELRVVHDGSATESGCERFHGSKYVQSDLNDTFCRAKCTLEAGKSVMFTGMPCQIAGLRSYLEQSGTNCDNLFLVDLICHGVTSPLIWQEYRRFLERKYHVKVVTVETRSKRCGWKGYAPTAVFANGVVRTGAPDVRSYLSCFFSGMSYRPSCYQCPYSRHERISDLTIGDFWGIEQCDSLFADNFGVSLVLVNTKKGERMIDNAERHCELRYSRPDEYLPFQNNLRHPSSQSGKTELMWQCFHQHGYQRTAARYFEYNIYYRFRYLVKNCLKRCGFNVERTK